jgi:hypothetical protein
MRTLINFITSLFFNMSKEYKISDARRVLVKKEIGDYSITIEETGSDTKSLTFSGRRFAQLISFENLIDQNLSCLLAKQNVEFKAHLGGGYFVSITSGFYCIDIRENYFHKTKGLPCASKRGIALRLPEWRRLKEIFAEINHQFPALARIESCSTRLDHLTLEGYMSCAECHPFRAEEVLFSQKQQPSFT